MAAVEIVEQDLDDPQPWEPPLWLLALGLSLALLIGLIQSGQVHDPRIANRPAPTGCAPRPLEQNPGVGWVWTYCPDRR